MDTRVPKNHAAQYIEGERAKQAIPLRLDNPWNIGGREEDAKSPWIVHPPRHQMAGASSQAPPRLIINCGCNTLQLFRCVISRWEWNYATAETGRSYESESKQDKRESGWHCCLPPMKKPSLQKMLQAQSVTVTPLGHWKSVTLSNCHCEQMQFITKPIIWDMGKVSL